MRILPVLDIMKGLVVRGIAGRRENYRPIVTPLSNTPDPVAIAKAFRTHFGLDEIYFADLDAIAGSSPSLEIYRELKAAGFSLWLDAGLRHAEDGTPLLAAGVDNVIAGLETLAGPHELARLSSICLPERIVFSLDLRDGEPVVSSDEWKRDVSGIIAQVVEHGIRSVIVLDLARVGVNEGTGTDEVCRRLIQEFRSVSFFAGGGVRDRDDLKRLSDIGVAGVLVASALHDGRLNRTDLDRLMSRQ